MKRRRTTLPKRPQGRQTSYAGKVTNHQAYVCTSLGGRTNELADFFSISKDTVWLWQRTHASFDKAVKKGRDDFNSGRVGSVLLKRAMGYDVEEVTREYIKIDGQRLTHKRVAGKKLSDGKPGKSRMMLVPGEKIKRTIKHIQPSDVAIFFWLCNRSPERWKHIQKQIVEHSGTVKSEVDLSKVPKEELNVVRDILARAQADAERDTGRSGNGTRVPFSTGIRQVSLASGRN